MEQRRLRLEGIEDIEVMELEEVLGTSLIDVDHPTPGSADRHGDFGLTAAVILLGPAAMTALATWLARKEAGSLEKVKFNATVRPDGTLVLDLKSLKRKGSSEPPDPETIKSLISGLNEQFGKALSSLAEGGVAGG